ncbi:YraN family protein [Marinobacter sp. SS21]|uniref:YraN family protein n=1 Tax=Marinobacter sp. SS21 TaxID=2979460 RepID=UPI00232F133D|nr:YraN family protein [Marinobacter sp. SS21]MDC0664091.1 YraN family protein [Marinobacter sp. SS21]
MNTKRATGQQAEDVAARYLQRRGVRITCRNVYNRGGEIDLIGMDGNTLVFFEVRYRGHGSMTGAAESISYRKQQRILRAANYYLHRHGLWNADARIDVVAVSPGTIKRFNIQWIKNAIQSPA